MTASEQQTKRPLNPAASVETAARPRSITTNIYMMRDIDGNIGLEWLPMMHDKILAQKSVTITEGEGFGRSAVQQDHTSEKVKLLGQALGNVLKKAGVIGHGDLTGPELLSAAESFCATEIFSRPTAPAGEPKRHPEIVEQCQDYYVIKDGHEVLTKDGRWVHWSESRDFWPDRASALAFLAELTGRGYHCRHDRVAFVTAAPAPERKDRELPDRPNSPDDNCNVLYADCPAGTTCLDMMQEAKEGRGRFVKEWREKLASGTELCSVCKWRRYTTALRKQLSGYEFRLNCIDAALERAGGVMGVNRGEVIDDLFDRLTTTERQLGEARADHERQRKFILDERDSANRREAELESKLTAAELRATEAEGKLAKVMPKVIVGGRDVLLPEGCYAEFIHDGSRCGIRWSSEAHGLSVTRPGSRYLRLPDSLPAGEFPVPVPAEEAAK